MALAPCIAADVGLQFAQHPVQSDGVAGLGGGEQGCIDPDHRGPSSDLRPAMAHAGQKPISAVSAVSTPLMASTKPSSVRPICVSEQARINAPPITRAQLSLEPMFLRKNISSPRSARLQRAS